MVTLWTVLSLVGLGPAALTGVSDFWNDGDGHGPPPGATFFPNLYANGFFVKVDNKGKGWYTRLRFI